MRSMLPFSILLCCCALLPSQVVAARSALDQRLRTAVPSANPIASVDSVPADNGWGGTAQVVSSDAKRLCFESTYNASPDIAYQTDFYLSTIDKSGVQRGVHASELTPAGRSKREPYANAMESPTLFAQDATGPVRNDPNVAGEISVRICFAPSTVLSADTRYMILQQGALNRFAATIPALAVWKLSTIASAR